MNLLMSYFFKMNNKLYKIFFVLFSVFFMAQTKQELDKAMLSKDPKEISDFIKRYPNNSNVPFLKRKLDNFKGSGSSSAKPTIKPLNTERLEKQVAASNEKGERDAKTQRTVEVLNHLFNNNPNKKEAYVLIKNTSDCNLIVKLEGKKFYNLDVPKKGENYIMVPKGSYKVTTMICNARYTSVKNVTQDIEIDLGIEKKARN